jgi:hypothetical protein
MEVIMGTTIPPGTRNPVPEAIGIILLSRITANTTPR